MLSYPKLTLKINLNFLGEALFMSAKGLYFGGVLLTSLLMVTGCATTDKPEDRALSQYRMASDECIRFGYRRDSYDFNRCVERRLKSGE